MQESPPGALVEKLKVFVERFADRFEKAAKDDYHGAVQMSLSMGGLHFSQKQVTKSIGAKADFVQWVRNIRYLGKGTYIDCALSNMTAEMVRGGHESRALRFAVVITDGIVTGNPCGGIKVTAERARDQHIRIFV